MSKKSKDVFVVGMALFAMFFGAGNLIFPPALGLVSGKSWIQCMIGFFLTGIGMPILGILAVSKAGGTINDLGNKINPIFSKILGTVIILAIGPLLAIPRTGATVFEMGVKPIFKNSNSIIFSIIYFGITLFFVIKPSGIVDKIGKFLTPILLLIVSAIMIKGIISPIGTPITTNIEKPFSTGFVEGYQTMDALASIVFGGIIMLSLAEKGYNSKKEQINLTMKAGLIAGIGLAFVYGGLLYIGATSSSIFPTNIHKTNLIIGITEKILGSFGKYGIGLAVSVACLTTSIGLTATVGNYFNNLTNGKLSYKIIVIATTIFSAIFANIGVEQIIKFAVPLLVTVYPIAIVLIIMSLFDNFIKNKGAYSGAVFGALFVSLIDGFSAIGINTSFIGKFMNTLPLSKAGFAWILPAIIGSLISSKLIINKNRHNSI
ncbi:branched-chain amino acid:cation transporter, LIVCS family [Caminicella sporogenes DSM 14501]|uniref:Branched-chain amino acid transport system carrier protein n=1 Tax=Caminicella sporogenes DSM 14501 TaxID=1121266 RepID=A0A1M6P3Z9_9FIRM|nr:branched-chain amino acid transport system II carrier protein [Caminicella sporogenes]RKD21539.1 branched-chain amino acid transport system II carrier protein [Caminicella sporogenes]SHK02623.1 branched-chain amino acid:cation transporter, LIVCS family [Caminicella sporogenes DSM 14501]